MRRKMKATESQEVPAVSKERWGLFNSANGGK